MKFLRRILAAPFDFMYYLCAAMAILMLVCSAFIYGTFHRLPIMLDIVNRRLDGMGDELSEIAEKEKQNKE